VNDQDQAHVPPYSDELEQSVLGAMLMDNRVWERLGDVLAEADFYSPRHRTIFRACTALLTSGVPADVITVFEKLQSTGDAEAAGGLGYLNALAQSVPSAANARRYAMRVRELSLKRTLIETATNAIESARGATDVADAADAIASAFGSLAMRQGVRAPRPIAEIALERIDHYTALEQGTVAPGWPTSIPALDAKLNGGLRAGALYILAARPSVGKSSLSQSIGLATAATGLPTLFLSMEMAVAEVTDRGVSNVGRVSSSALQTGSMTNDDWIRTSEAMERLVQLPFHIDDQPALTLRDVRLKAKSVRDIKVLIVDYLQLCASSRRDGNRNSEIEEISRGLKTLAKELGIAIIALSQLNRDVEKRTNKRPTLSDLRDSGAIEQDADVVMFLWPVKELEAEGRRVLGLGIDKNRQGRLGDVGLDFYGDTQRWEQSTADIRPAAAPRYQRGDL
jgi:replicative DNA helicase